MLYYHIDRERLEVLFGPAPVSDAYFKRLTACGNPDLLNLSEYAIVPEVRPTLGRFERCSGSVVVTADAVMIQVEPILLPEAQAQAHAVRTAERFLREATTYPHEGSRYDCDERSAIRWGLVVSMALLVIGSAPDTVIVPSGWRDTEGTPRLYTAAQILAAQQSLLLWGAQCDAAAQAMAADIDAAETIADLEAIISAIPTDARWPA